MSLDKAEVIPAVKSFIMTVASSDRHAQIHGLSVKCGNTFEIATSTTEGLPCTAAALSGSGRLRAR